jgi:UDP-2,3-diacylglucosamine pyrophosphatase LpxH
MATQFLSIPPEGFAQHDELYVVSDLHLGGLIDFQIFNSGVELARLINYLRDYQPEKEVAFLINGDFVDFLAESPARHFDPEDAVKKLNRISEDASFKDVFDALQVFVAKKKRRLILTLGNHDLELALPWVRTRLLDVLSNGNEEARGRITCAFEGTGYRCRIGKATVLCVHGNEVDPWNLADYETIRRFGRDVLQGQPVNSWIPNAGSKLVIEVMNGIKKNYPFVDLLKPETQAAVPILLALDPDQHEKLRAIGATVRRLAWDSIRSATGFLGGPEPGQDLTGRTVSMASFTQLPSGFTDPQAFEFDRRETARTLLDDAEDRLNQGIKPMSIIGTDQLGASLGLTGAIMKIFKGADTAEVLREALQNLRNDRSFDPTTEDITFRLLDDKVGDGIDFMIAGHTHLARALARKKKFGWYFNSGTWARLIKLDDNVLGDAESFKKVMETFRKQSMCALDEHPNLILRRLTVVAVRAEGAVTHGELRQTSLSPQDPVLPDSAEYRFTKQ